MLVLHYCRSWFAAKRLALEPLSEGEARRRHASAQSYCVLVGSNTHPACVVKVTAKFVGVDFLDENLQEKLTYHFQERAPGMLFLTMAVHREFLEDTDRVARGTSYTFQLDGRATIRKEEFVPAHSVEVADITFDTAANWEEYPPFGAYERFLEAERGHAC